jgi:alkylation response protein AidB-like acyl-CoA dehydrogenase
LEPTEHALRYATERKHFSEPTGGFQLVLDLLVRMLGNVTLTLAMMLRLAQLQDERGDAGRACIARECIRTVSSAARRSAMRASCSGILA